MHILHVINSLEFGGAEKVVVHLANQFCEKHQVSICLFKRKGELVEELNDKIKLHFFDTGEGNSLEVPKRLAALLKSEKVDVLHSHNWGVFLESAMAVKKVKGVRMIHTAHGRYNSYSPGLVSKLKITFRHFLERKMSRHVDTIATVSEAIRASIINDIGISATKVQTVHNGIAGNQSIVEKTEVDAKPRPSRFIAVGRVAEVKNFPFLLRAFALALKDAPDIRLTIAGDGPELPHIKALAQELSIADKVDFLGFRDDIPRLLAQHDVFVLSSDYEGISIAILEAMSMAMPVIATRVGGNPETLQDGITGYLVTPNDDPAFAKAMVVLAQFGPKLQGMGEAGRDYFNQHFHESVVLQKYEALYQGR